jgi:hypothetical protein
MSDIQDEAYSEAMDEIKRKDAEIDRLKASLDASRKLLQIWIDKSANQTQLLTRAAYALSKVMHPCDEVHDIIKKLREAAK